MLTRFHRVDRRKGGIKGWASHGIFQQPAERAIEPLAISIGKIDAPLFDAIGENLVEVGFGLNGQDQAARDAARSTARFQI